MLDFVGMNFWWHILSQSRLWHPVHHDAEVKQGSGHVPFCQGNVDQCCVRLALLDQGADKKDCAGMVAWVPFLHLVLWRG